MLKRAAAVLVLAGLLVGLDAVPAFAHAVLLSTDPTASAALARSPKTVTLTFGENVEASLGAIRVYNQQGERVDVSAPFHPGGRGSEVAATLPSLRSGLYVVTWRVISADSHPVHGAFTFQVGSGSTTATGGNANTLVNQLLNKQRGSSTVGVVYGIVRFGVFVGLALLIGGMFFLGVIWPEGRTSRRAARVVWAGFWGTLVLTALAFAIQGVYAVALPLTSMLHTSELDGIWHTQFGHISALRVALLVVLVPLLLMLLSPQRARRQLPRWWYLGAAVVCGAIAFTPGLAGHAHTGRWTVGAVPADAIHVAAMAIWMGGLALLGACVLTRGEPQLLRRVLPRFSVVALSCVVAIVATGVFQAYRQVGSIHALRTTDYGRLLVIKTGIVVLVVIGAAMSRAVVNRWFRFPLEVEAEPEPDAVPAHAGVAVGAGSGAVPRGGLGVGTNGNGGNGGNGGTGERESGDDDPDDTDDEPLTMEQLLEDEHLELSRLRRSVFAEVVLGIVVLAVTAMLVNAAPAISLETAPFFKTVSAGGDYYDLIVSPAKSGPNQVHVTTSTRAGAPAGVLQMTITFDNPGKGIAPINVPLLRLAPGHYASYSFQFPFGGTWRMTVKALLTQVNETTFSTNVRVR
jgi:copper transport protein